MFMREASCENYGPRGLLIIFAKTLIYFATIYFTLFPIYHIQFNLAIDHRGIDNPSFALGARICCLCAGTANEVLRDSPT